ncbi:putative amp dependent ligase [Rosellinia necatrix]|uniref:Putative amp dependent ligase n=1 Tax=Rosellinia necatrix TaxID=77044 RepID=A0A1S7UKV1_ROSNE|nr:putative amp dependent ligase [Rosellinia necatrix]
MGRVIAGPSHKLSTAIHIPYILHGRVASQSSSAPASRFSSGFLRVFSPHTLSCTFFVTHRLQSSPSSAYIADAVEMATIMDLPCELIVLILRKLEHLQSLLPALLACRHFYSSFKQYRGIEAEILRQQITPGLVPYAIAALEASRLPQPITKDTIRRQVGHLYDRRPQLVALLPTMPVVLVRSMARMHDLVDALANEFAATAWARLDKDTPFNAVLRVGGSPTEYFRFCRAFYEFELFCQLFRGEEVPGGVHFINHVYTPFLSRYSLWEMEQLACVHDFLAERFSKASFDALAHDVYFGQLRIDYVTPASLNLWTQQFVSQGLAFLYRLRTSDSFEAKVSVLKSTLHHEHITDLPGAIDLALDLYVEDDTLEPAERCSKDKLMKSYDENDTDDGPFRAWQAGHSRIVPYGAWAMLPENAWLRRRAYVFWDLDRIHRNNLLVLSEKEPTSPSPDDSKDIDDMFKSFDIRSEIWQEGGSGYWSEGDTSRIQYIHDQSIT